MGLRPAKDTARPDSFLGRFFHPLSASKVRILQNRPLRNRILLTLLATVSLAFLLALGCDAVARHFAIAKQKAAAAHLAFEVNGFVIHHFSDAANFIARSQEVFNVLSELQPPDNAHLLEELSMARGILDVSLVFVLDRYGTVVASTPYGNNRTLTGNNYQFRPYFFEAMTGRSFRYAAIGVTTKERGLYFSEPVGSGDGKTPLGVMVVKVPLDFIDYYINNIDQHDALLLSPDGIVFSASRPEWLYRAALPLTDAQRQRLHAGQQFSDQPLDPLPFYLDKALLLYNGKRYSVHFQETDLPGWRIATLHPLSYPLALVFFLSFVVLVAGFVVILGFLHAYKQELLTQEVQQGRERNRRAEDSRLATLRELETILAASLVGILLVRDGRITSMNDKLCAILGYPEAEIRGAEVRLFFPSRSSFRQFIRMYARQLARRDLEHIEYMLRRKDGTLIPCSLSGRAIDPDDLSQGVVWVVEDIRERKKAQQDLEQARTEAETASRAKSEFLANVSHEIRTPMNGIIGITEFLLSREQDADRMGKLSLILASARRLMKIINDILEFSKHGREWQTLDYAPFQPRVLLQEVIGSFAMQAKSKGVALELVVDERIPAVLIGDEMRLMQVLFNLIGNGLKFTEQGAVIVRAMLGETTRPDETRVLFEVIDSGIGIDPAQQDAIFEAFVQADASHSRRYGGTGLGLPISRRFVQLMGGDIRVESETGKGSRFWFELPFSRESSRAAISAPPVPIAGREHGPLLDGHVLLAEDDLINTTLATALLEHLGLSVTAVGNGRDALENWRSGGFSCILMDLQMPEMDGYEAVRRIREEEKKQGRHVPIIALTACVMDGDRERCLAASMDAYIAKPVDRGELYRLLRKFIPAKGSAISEYS